MRTNRLIRIAALSLVSAIVIAGCSSAGDNAAATTEVKQPANAKMGVGDNVSQAGATVVNDPKNVKQGGAYKLAPADPNNEAFKPDPKLGGGG